MSEVPLQAVREQGCGTASSGILECGSRLQHISQLGRWGREISAISLYGLFKTLSHNRYIAGLMRRPADFPVRLVIAWIVEGERTKDLLGLSIGM